MAKPRPQPIAADVNWAEALPALCLGSFGISLVFFLSHTSFPRPSNLHFSPDTLLLNALFTLSWSQNDLRDW